MNDQQPMIDENTDLAEAQQMLERKREELKPLETEIATERLRRQETKVRDLTAECRRAKDALEELDGQVGLAQSGYRAAANELRQAEFELEQHLREKPLDSNFPSEKELQDWRAALSKKRDTVDRSMETSAKAYRMVENLQNQRRVDHIALTKLTDDRNRLSGSLPALRTTVEKLIPTVQPFRYNPDQRLTVVLDSIAIVTR